jgi:hypothetical protein
MTTLQRAAAARACYVNILLETRRFGVAPALQTVTVS